MKGWNRMVITAAIAAAVVGVLLAGYAMRGRLAGLPGIGRLLPTAQPAETSATSKPAEVGSASADRAVARTPLTLDARRQQLIGVRLVTVERTQVTPTVRAVGMVRYDETRLADVNVKLEGWIRDLYVDSTGAHIQKGQPLFSFYSPDLVTTENEYLLALRARDQMRRTPTPDAQDYADRLVEAARRRLLLWDVPDEQLAALETERTVPAAVTFRSPVSGYVIDKPALAGLHVTPGQSLYRVADLSVVWVEAEIYERETSLVHLNARATVSLDAYPGESFAGRVVYIYPYVDEKTRTGKVRFQFANPGGRMKPGMYSTVVTSAPGRLALHVPANAVLDSGRGQVVFVSEGDGRFDPRPVKAGLRFGDDVEILDGLKEGEQVATGAAFFLDSESQLRAALQEYTAAPAVADSGDRAPALERLDIAFRSQPDPPRTGSNSFEVTVKDAMGMPVADGDVSVVFYMAGMPAMNMPAMRTETPLSSAGAGIYRGVGQVLGGGRWSVTATVTRGGRPIGSREFSVVVR